MKAVSFLFIISLFSITSFAQSWTTWSEVIPFPAESEIDYDSIRSVYYEVYDVKAVRPEACSSAYCFRVAIYINGEMAPFAVLPTSPGSTRYSWGGRTPEFRNATLAPAPGWGYQEYRLHNRGYKSNPRPGRPSSNLRYFSVFLSNGKDVGIGFHGDKGGVYKVTGAPESHGCLRVHDNNAKIINYIARAVIDNTGSAHTVRLSAYHTRSAWF